MQCVPKKMSVCARAACGQLNRGWQRAQDVRLGKKASGGRAQAKES